MSHLVRRLGPGEADALLGTPLLPCLVRAFGHASADVRKAVSHFPCCNCFRMRVFPSFCLVS